MVVFITSNFSNCPNKSIYYLTIYAKKLFFGIRNWRDYWMPFPADPGAGSSGPEGWQRITACARVGAEAATWVISPQSGRKVLAPRSEERRVGKEWRSRWWEDD